MKASEAATPAIEFRKVLSGEDPMLERFYRLYSRVFTLPEEREPIEGFRQVLRLNGVAGVQSDFGPLAEHILLAVDQACGAVIGAANYSIYGYPDCMSGIAASCQLNFLCVDQPWRNRGVASRLLEKMEHDLREQAERGAVTTRAFITCEQNNPQKMTEKQIADDHAASLIDPYERLRWWQRRNYHKLVFPYSQPPLNPGQAPCEYLDYYIRFTDLAPPSVIPGAVLLEHLRRFFFVSVGKLVADMAQNPQWIAMERFLSSHAEIDLV